MADPKSKNPAAGFLIMAGFNVLAAVVFIVCYFLYGADGDDSFFFLIAAGVSVIAAGGLLAAYGVFKKKLQNLR